MSVECGRTDVYEHVRLLHTHNVNIASEAYTALKEAISAGEGWDTLVDFYFGTRSEKVLELISTVREPNEKILLEKLTDGLRYYPVEVITILNHVLLKQASWLQRLTQQSIFTAIIKMIRDSINNADEKSPTLYMHVVNGLLFLCNLLPHMALLTKGQLEDMMALLFKSSELLLNSAPSPVLHTAANNNIMQTLIQPVYYSHLKLAITVYFQRLYGIFPCNTMHFVKSHFGDRKKYMKDVIKPLLLTVRFHPFLLQHNRETEMSRERWMRREVHDMDFECRYVTVQSDPVEPLQGVCMCGGLKSELGGLHESLTSRLSVFMDSVAHSPMQSKQVSPMKPIHRPNTQESAELIRPAPIRLPMNASDPNFGHTNDIANSALFWSPSMSISLDTPPESRRETPIHHGLNRRDSMRSHTSGQSHPDRRSGSSTEPSYKQRKSFGQAMAKIFRSSYNEPVRLETEEEKTDAMCKAIIEMATQHSSSVPASPLQPVAEASFIHGRQASQVSQAEEATEATAEEAGRMSLAQLDSVSDMLRSEPAAAGTEDSEVQRFTFNGDATTPVPSLNRTQSGNSMAGVRSRQASGRTSRKSSYTPKDSRHSSTVEGRHSSTIESKNKPTVVFTVTESQSPIKEYLASYNQLRFNRIRVQSECPTNENQIVLTKRGSTSGQTPVRKRSNSCPRNLFASESQVLDVREEDSASPTKEVFMENVPNLLSHRKSIPQNIMNQLFPYVNIMANIAQQRQGPAVAGSVMGSVAQSEDDAYSSEKTTHPSPPVHELSANDYMQQYLTASKRVYEASMTSGGSGSLGKGSKNVADSVINGLKAQLAMCHQQILFERYQKILHAQRNRTLFGRFMRSMRKDEDLRTMNEKMLLWDKTREEMLKVIHALYHQKKKLVQDANDLQYKMSQKVKDHVQEQHDLMQKLEMRRIESLDLQTDNDSLREQMKIIQKELFEIQANNMDSLQDRQEKEDVVRRVSELDTQLLNASEMHSVLLASYQQRVDELAVAQAHAEHMHTNVESLRKEIVDLRRQVRKERGKCDTWSSKAMDTEAQLKRAWQQMHEHQTQIKELRGVHKAHVKALNVKQQTLMNVCQRLEVYIGELNAVIESNTVSQHPHSLAIDVSIPNRPGSKEIVSYGSSFGEIPHSFSSNERPLSSLARTQLSENE